MTYADTVLADSPLGYWQLEEASGNFDDIGSGNHRSTKRRGPVGDERLDEIAVYTTALSSTRIAAHYDAAPNPNASVPLSVVSIAATVGTP